MQDGAERAARVRSMIRLMAITSELMQIDELAAACAAAVRGGATSVQVRLKDATARVMVQVTREIMSRVDVPVIVNDRFDVALACGAAGAHLGADDVPVSLVRRSAPPEFIIGTSVGNDAEVDNAADADYVGIGPVFGTPSKADAGAAIGLGELARLISLVRAPAIAIGGIDGSNARSAIEAGAAGVATISALFGRASGDPETAAREMCRAIGS